MRQFANISLEHINSVKNYIDVVTGKPDKEAKSLLQKLKYEKVLNALTQENIVQYNISWVDPDGMIYDHHKGMIK